MKPTQAQIERAIREVLTEEDILTDQVTEKDREDADERAHETYMKHLLRSEIRRMVKLINSSLKSQRRSSCSYEDILRHIQNYELAKKAKLPAAV